MTYRVLDLTYENHKIYYDHKGYACVWIDGKNRLVHVLEWEKHNGPKPDGFEIHHKDENKANFSFDNLELLSPSDHQKLHAGWVRENGEWTKKSCTKYAKILSLSAFYPRKGYTPSAKCKSCHNVEARAWAKNNPEKRRQSALAYYHRRAANG